MVVTAVLVGSCARGRDEVFTRDVDHAEQRAEIDDTFVFEFAERYNEHIVANVDAIDTALVTILAGDVAVPGEHRPPGFYFFGPWSIGRKPIDMSKPAPPPKPRDER